MEILVDVEGDNCSCEIRDDFIDGWRYWQLLESVLIVSGTCLSY